MFSRLVLHKLFSAKNANFYHGDLGVTYMLQPELIGKAVIDFLFMTISFSPAIIAEACREILQSQRLRAKY